MDCGCLNEINEDAAFYCRDRNISPVSCDECLDIMTRKKWRTELAAIRKRVEKEKAQVHRLQHAPAPPRSNPVTRRPRPSFADEAQPLSPEIEKVIQKRVRTPRLPKPEIKVTITPNASIPVIERPIKIIKRKPDPDCPICAIARLFGKVESCPCMQSRVIYKQIGEDQP